jgi:hypothetical protein
MPRQSKLKRRCTNARLARYCDFSENSEESDYIHEPELDSCFDEIEFNSNEILDMMKNFVTSYFNKRALSVFVYSILR